jgi:hypothetical protein
LFINNDKVYNYYYIHNAFADFFDQTLDFLRDSFGPRFHTLMGTYDKAVEFIRDKELNEGEETQMEKLPLIALNPTGEFRLSNWGGYQPWRLPNVSAGLSSKIYPPIYQDENVFVTLSSSRITGEIEVIFFASSFYEFCDIRMMLLHAFNGIGRKVYPFILSTFVILPEELYFYGYSNEYTNESYTLDWANQGSTTRLIKSTAQEKYIYQTSATPMFSLTSLGDASRRYGGTDDVAEWKVLATFEYDVELPSYLYLETDYLLKKIDLNIMPDCAYSYYSTNFVPDTILRTTTEWEPTVENEDDYHIVVTDRQVTTLPSLELKIRYYHVITTEEEASEDDVQIVVPEEITDIELLKVYTLGGNLFYGDEYNLENNTIIIKRDKVTLSADQIIELYIYKEVETF